MGVDHSHMLITTLRSTPCGRSGLAKGNSPAAMRSVQSANSDSALSGPSRPERQGHVGPRLTGLDAARPCLDRVAEFRRVPCGIVRTPLEPSAWHDWHEFLIVSIQ